MEGNPFKDHKDVAMVPNYTFEKMADRYMTIIKWLVIVIIVLILSLVGYAIYNSQMETVSYEQEAEATENSNINMNASGELTVYGNESKAEDHGNTEETESPKRNAD